MSRTISTAECAELLQGTKEVTLHRTRVVCYLTSGAAVEFYGWESEHGIALILHERGEAKENLKEARWSE